MVKLNPSFQRLKREYIFPLIEKKLEELKGSVSRDNILNFGVGDIALPLAPSIVKAICLATEEMATETGIRGYPPTTGYLFLKEAIASSDYANTGVMADELFISDGINSDIVNILELFPSSASIAIPNPTYPAYLDSAVLGGRKKITILPCLEEHRFAPQIPQEHCDLIYLCTPNNPTGVALTREELTQWVDYALREDALLLVDSAYEAFITSSDVPRTIFEIPGAEECAIEFRSFSKSAGFTGLRCAYTVLRKTVRATLGKRKIALHPFWERRQATKFNGVAYPIQRGAEAVYSSQGLKETRAQVSLYLAQAGRLQSGLKKLGFTCFGGIDSPYIWWKTPKETSSWDFFDHLLQRCQLISIPGKGFGEYGEGYVRLSAFTTPEKTSLALERLQYI
jgi:LL-diaminopimelate aminotransferase